jgi:hypothetical protein
MRIWVLMVAIVLAGPVQAAECTLSNSRYVQDKSPWVLTFQRVPRYGSPTQIAAFALELPNSGVTLDGAVHGSMGFGSPLWSIEGPCGTESKETCSFLMENQSPAIYGLYGDRITFLTDEAPDQVILPQLSVSLWYSQYREDEWDGDVEPGDAFVLEGCE